MSRTSSTAVPTTTTPPSSSRRCPARSSTGSGPVTPAFRYCTSTPRPRPRLRPVAPGPEPGSPLEKRAIRQVGTTFALAGVFAFLFLVVYVGSGWFLPEWDWAREGTTWSTLFTPLLGLCMGLSLLLVGVGLVLFTKKLLPHETAVQDKHDG